MIEGMTGFGRSSAGKSGCRWTVEIRSLNHRFFDFSARLPTSFSLWEADLQKLLQSRLKRGKISLSALLSTDKTNGEKVVLDETKLDFYMRTLKKVAKRYRLDHQISVRDFLSLPNLFTVEKKEVSTDYWKSLKSATEEAMDRLLRMRIHEGKTLAKDLLNRVKKIGKSIKLIETVSKQSLQDYRKKLKDRLEGLDEKIKVDPDRLAKEVVFQAERSDITEEIVRAKHHLDSFSKTLQENGEAGKKLDFTVQELNREVNTIASKAQNFKISNEVVRVKSELEKIREQIQNIV